MMKKFVFTLIILLTFNFTFTACAPTNESSPFEPNTGVQSIPEKDPYEREDADLEGIDDFAEQKLNVTLKLIDLGNEVNIHAKTQRDFINDDCYAVEKYAKGVQELSRPEAVVLNWKADFAENVKIDYYRVDVCENKSFDEVLTYRTDNYPAVSVLNLKIATKYFWRVTVVKDGEDVAWKTSAFTTAGDSPRNLFVGGITNVRDMGGYVGLNGKRIRQGLIFRSARFNHSNSSMPIAIISENGIKTMTETLKIKTEIDLRHDAFEAGNCSESVLGTSVQYRLIPMSYEEDMIYYNQESIKNVFSVFADESSYPMVFHCSIGTDRTGLVAFLLNAYLGVSEDDLRLDYAFSNFGDIGGGRSPATIDEYIKKMRIYEGETLSEKTGNFLLSIGVTQIELDNIRSVMFGMH